MAEISSLLTLQGQLALLTLIGFFLARKGIINAQGRKCLTDLLINVILPANIIQSFLVEFSWDVLKSSASILVISLALQIGCVVLCALGYNWLPFARRSVYQYAPTVRFWAAHWWTASGAAAACCSAPSTSSPSVWQCGRWA